MTENNTPALAHKKTAKKLSHSEKIALARKEADKLQNKIKLLTEKRKLEIGSLAEKYDLLDLDNSKFEEVFSKLKVIPNA